MSKWAEPRGALVQSVPLTDPDALRLNLPERLRVRPEAANFLQRVADLCAHHAAVGSDLGTKAPAPLRDAITALADASHRMRTAASALGVLSTDEGVFEALDAHYRYLAFRANEGPDVPQAGRPVVPELPRGLPSNLAGLASRLDDLLIALQLTCGHAADRIQPSSVVVKQREASFALDVVHAHLEAFGEMPPAGGWWRDFMQEVGQRMGWNIGHAVTAAAVKRARESGAPSLD